MPKLTIKVRRIDNAERITCMSSGTSKPLSFANDKEEFEINVHDLRRVLNTRCFEVVPEKEITPKISVKKPEPVVNIKDSQEKKSDE